MNKKDAAVAAMSKIQPTLRVDEEDLPQIKDWKVGSEYTLAVKVKMISSRQGSEFPDESEAKAKHSAVFRVVTISNDDDDSKPVKRSPIAEGIKKKAESY